MGSLEVFRKRLVELRLEHKMTQQDLADDLGVSRTTVASWETGHRNPDIAELDRIASRFQVSTDYLLGRTDIRYLDLPPWIEKLRPEWQRMVVENEELAKMMLRVLNRETVGDLPPRVVEKLLENQIESYKIIQEMMKEDKV